MKIAVISTPVFRITPPQGTSGYSGLEVIAYQCAKGLAEKGHEVFLAAPDGSTCPGVTIWPVGPERQVDERMAHDRIWKELLKVGCVVDHSVVGSEFLLVRIDGKSRWLSFEELFDWAMESGRVLFSRGSVEVVVSGLEVPSAVDEFTVKWRRVSSVIRHLKKDTVHRVCTKGGNIVKLTAGHGLMVAGRGGLEECRAADSVGEHVAVARSIPAAKRDLVYWPLDLSDLGGLYVKGEDVTSVVVRFKKLLMDDLREAGLSYNSAHVRWRAWRDKSVPVDLLPEVPEHFWLTGYAGCDVKWPVPLTDSDLVMFGLWVGDGCYDREVSVRLSSGHETKYVADCVAGEFSASCKETTYRPDVNHQINSKILVILMKALGFVGYSESKRIPDWVFGLSERQIGLFLRGYFSADGHVSSEGGVVLGSVNEVLIQQVSVLLALCGLKSHVCSWVSKGGYADRVSVMWELGVSCDDRSDFKSRVGFVQESKVSKLSLGHLKRRSWRGDVPYCLVRERRVRSDSVKKGRVVSLSKLARLKGDEIADKFKAADVRWLRVKSAEPIENSDKYVYDLSVPGTENFFVGLVCCHNSWQKHSYLLKAEGVLKAPVLGVLHAPVNTMYQSLPPVSKPCFVCISEDQRSHFEGLFGRPARTCYNGIDLGFYKSLDIPRADRYLFLARFSSIKGGDLGIEACKKASASLDLVGDLSITNEPEYFEKCRNLCDGKQIRMVGPASRGETVYWYSQAKAMLHPNQRFREPLGLAPLEAQACNNPVIAYNYGAMRETVKHGETGFLVDSLEEMTGLIKTDAVSGLSRARCREWASQFSLQRMVDRYSELCEEAVSGGGW